jgi:hypothetical protein
MRYVTRPRGMRPRGDDYADYDDTQDQDRRLSVDIYCDDDPIDTGLLDANGDPIFRVKDPIGFRFSENE